MDRLFFSGLAFALATTMLAQQQTMRVGLFYDQPTDQVMVMGDGGALTIWVDGKQKAQLASSDGLVIKRNSKGIQARSLVLDLQASESLTFHSGANKGYRLRSMAPKGPEQAYSGSLELRVTGDFLQPVAIVPLEEYVAGVVQAEAGKGHWMEYYKLQAVSCRTYALANKRRHAGQGFEVCDATHCQVYKGRNRLDSIQDAVEATTDLVVVDSGIRLIHATFHSNCGGETVNAEDVWSQSEPYLKGTVDTFCLKEPHATWEEQIPRAKWLHYLHDRFGVNTADSDVVASITDYNPDCRDLYLANVSPPVPVKQVRQDWGLRSAFFSIHSVGDQVLLNGRGFGHGVGMCQEGAMHMARYGHVYTEILHHYFSNVHLVKLQNLEFFRDEGL